jgi:HSP20 family protein
MFGLTRWNPFEDIFNFQREVDRLFNQFWNDLPTRTASLRSPFQVTSTDDAWRIDVPLPGVDPQNVQIEVTGNTLNIRAEEPGKDGEAPRRYEHSFTVPQFLDLEKVKASHFHGMLQLTLPLKESVKPRRIQIEGVQETPKRISSAA